MTAISPIETLVFIMVTVSASDSEMTDKELQRIGNLVKTLPAFEKFGPDHLVKSAADCGALLQEGEGLQTILRLAKELPESLHETAYALAVEVAAADLDVAQEELRMLQMLRDTLDLDKLVVAAIEHSARVRHRRA